MIIAISSQNFKTITGHPGRTFRFLVYEIHNDQVISKLEKEIPKNLVFHNFFHEMGATIDTPHPLDYVDVFITASSGQGFVNRMAARGKKVVITSETNPDVAVEKFLKNELILLEAEQHHH